MNKESIIAEAMAFIETLFSEDCSGHDVAHTKRVYRNAMMLAKTEPQCDTFIVALAALLHDADDHKLFSTENNANARKFLAEAGIQAPETERICQIINSVSFSKNRGNRPETIEAMIVQDADRLDALGAVGVARTFAYGGQRKRPMEDSIQHFYDKLLLLKGEMNTEAGKKIARTRHDFLEQFLRAWDEETNPDNG